MPDTAAERRLSQADRPGPWADGALDIEGHRGARGLVVENTLAGFEAALDAGVTGIELDVRMSVDGHLVVWHDPVLFPHKCRSTAPDVVGRRVDELTLAQLRTVDVGSQTLAKFPNQRTVPGAGIPTLAEVMGLSHERTAGMWWTIEVKSDPTDERQVARRVDLVEATLGAIYDAGVQRRCFMHSFDWAVLETSKRLDPDVLRSALTQEHHFSSGSPWTGSIHPEAHGGDVISGAAALDVSVISPDFTFVDADFVERAHRLGLAVLPWTVNEPEDLVRMHDHGVDGIVTDYPDVALQVLGARS